MSPEGSRFAGYVSGKRTAWRFGGHVAAAQPRTLGDWQGGVATPQRGRASPPRHQNARSPILTPVGQTTRYVLRFRRGEPPRVGEIVSRPGDSTTQVRWVDNGEQFSFAKPPITMENVEPDSIGEFFCSGSDTFLERAQEQPQEVLRRLLRGSQAAKPRNNVTRNQMKDRLAQFGLSPQQAAGIVTAGLKALKKDPHLLQSGNQTYRWSEVPQDPFAWIDSLGWTAALDLVTKASASEEERLRAKAQVERLLATKPEPSWKVEAWGAELLSDRPPIADHEVLGDVRERYLARYLDRSGSELGDDEVVPLALLPRQSKSVDGLLRELPPARAEAVCTATIKGLAGSSSLRDASVVLQRLRAMSCSIPTSAAPTLLEMRGRMGAQTAENADSVESCEALITEAGNLPEAVGALADIDVSRLLFALREAPLTTGSLHESTLIEGAKRGLPQIEDPSIWRDADPLAVVDFFTGDPGPSLGARRDRVLAVVAGDQGTVRWTNRTLAAFALLPPKVLEGVDRQAVLQGLAGLRRDMPHLAVLTGAWEIADLGQEIVTLRAQVESLSSRLQESLRARTDLEATARASAAEARALKERNVDALDSQVRQAKLDALHLACALLDEIMINSAGDREVLIERSLGTAAGSGLLLIGVPGEEVNFDGELHDRVDGGAADRVKVVRPGYRWADEGDQPVLRRALVQEAE